MGMVMEPVPGKIGFGVNAKTGLPTPFVLVMEIWSAVPTKVVEVTVPEVDSTIKPLKLAFARFSACPVKDTVGSPEMPSPLVIARPAPETAKERPVMVVADVLTCIPVLEFTKDNKAPVVLILKSP